MKEIWGTYRGKRELVDTCEDDGADCLAGEYRLAFGPEWTIELCNPNKGE